MGTDELRAMIERASRYTEVCVAKTGRAETMWHAVTGDGRDLILPPPPVGKDDAAILVRALLKMVKATRVVFIDECWIVDAKSPEELQRVEEWLEEHGSLSDYDGRVEVVGFNAEDNEGRTLSGRRAILRDADGNVSLGPLEVDEPKVSVGRFVGLLPLKEGTRRQ